MDYHPQDPHLKKQMPSLGQDHQRHTQQQQRQQQQQQAPPSAKKAEPTHRALGACCCCCLADAEHYRDNADDGVLRWEQFKTTHGRHYSVSENARRRAIFRDNLRYIERENARLGTRAAYGTKSKSTLVSRVVFLEAALVTERHERTAMEEALTEAYSNTLREVIAQEEVRPGKRR